MNTVWIVYCLDCHFASIRQTRAQARDLVKYRTHQDHKMRIIHNIAYIDWKR